MSWLRTNRRRLAALGLLLTAVAGCSDQAGNPTAPEALDQQTADDLAMQTALALEPMGAEFETMVFSVGGGTPIISRPEGAQHDTSFTRNGITFVMGREFYDADGNAMHSYTPAAVRLVATFRAYGTRAGARDTMTVGRSAIHELRGIEAESDTVWFNGASTDTLMNRFESLDGTRRRYFYWQSEMMASNVGVLKGGPDHFPFTGTMTLMVSAERLRSGDRGDLERRFTALITIVFDGSPQPVVTVNGRFRYRWNPDQGTIARA